MLEQTIQLTHYFKIVLKRAFCAAKLCIYIIYTFLCSEILSSRAFGELSALSASLRSYEVFVSKGRIVKRDKGCANEGKRRQSNLMMYKCVIFILFYFIRAPRDDKGGTYSSIFPSRARHFRHFSPLKHHVLEQTYRKRAEKLARKFRITPNGRFRNLNFPLIIEMEKAPNSRELLTTPICVFSHVQKTSPSIMHYLIAFFSFRVKLFIPSRVSFVPSL